MRKSVFIVFLVLFVALNSFVTFAEPTWSSNQSNIISTYDGTTKSEFNISWSNATSVNIELNDTGTPYNCTASNDYGGDIWNCTKVLGANSGNQQYWKSYGTNASGTNTSDTWTFTINKGNSTSYLNINIDGVPYNETITNYTLANVSANESAAGDSDVNYTLWRNDTQLINGSSVWDSTSLQRGIYKFFYNTTGGANWTSGTTNNLYLYITDLNFSGNSTSQTSPIDYNPSRTYNFSINLTGNISNIIFESTIPDGTLHDYTNNTSTTYGNIVINNTSNTYWITFPALAANSSGYYYIWIANDTNNVWFNTSQTTYVINPVTITPSFTEGGSNSPWTEPSSTSVTLLCSSSYPVSLVISPCGSQTGSGQSVSCAVSTGTGTSYTTYTCSVSSVYNYTGSTTGTLNWGPSTLPPTGSPTTGSGNFSVIPSSNNITIELGSSKTVTFTLSNTFSGDIININISVSGLDSSWYSLDKTSITKVRHDGGTNTTQLTLNIPSDAEAKAYSIVVTASGKDFNLNTITRQTTITLTVSEKAQNATEGVITNASTTNVTGNETIGPTGLIIKPEDFRNIVLFIGLIAVGLVFLFRSNVTNFLIRGRIPIKPSRETKKEEKKPSVFSSIKNKIHGLSEHKLVIQVKKKEKEEKT